MSKAELKKRIYEYDFALHELNLFLNSHPTNKKAMELLAEYRRGRAALVAEYTARFGQYIVCPSDVPVSGCWEWLKGPWPWENNFMEA